MDLHENDQGFSGRHGPIVGAIFMANRATRKECFRLKLFGLPASKKGFVKRVKAGMMLFLFDHEERCLYGVFEATSDGRMNILPSAYSASGMSFPAQIKFKIIWKCKPLKEDEFRDAIKDNYFAPYKFHFDLSSNQVFRLLQLFSSTNTRLISNNENPITEICMKIREISSPAEGKMIEKSCSVKHERIGNNRNSCRSGKFSRTYEEDAISSGNNDDQIQNSERCTLELFNKYVVEPKLMISTNSSQNIGTSDENLPASMPAVYRDVSNENPSAEYKHSQLIRPNSQSIGTSGGNSLASSSFSHQHGLHTCVHEPPSAVFQTCNHSLGQNDTVYTRFSVKDTVNNFGSHLHLSKPERRAHLPPTNFQNLQNQIKYDSGASNEPVRDYYRYNYPFDFRSNNYAPDPECYDPSAPLVGLLKTDMLLDREPVLRERDYDSCLVPYKNINHSRDWYRNDSSGGCYSNHSAHMPLPNNQTFLNNLEFPQFESMQRNSPFLQRGHNSVSHDYEGYEAMRDHHLPCGNMRNINISCPIVQSEDHPRYSAVSQFSAMNHFSSVSRDQENDETNKDCHFLHSSRSSINALSPRPINSSASTILLDNTDLGTSQINIKQNPSLKNKFSSFSQHCDYSRIEDCGLSNTNSSNLNASRSSLPSDCIKKNGSVFSRLSIIPEKNALSKGDAHESDIPSLNQLVDLLLERSSKWGYSGVLPEESIETSIKLPQNSSSQVELGNSDSAVKIEPENQSVSVEIGLPFVNFRRRSLAQKPSGETTERTKKRRKLIRPSFGEYDTQRERCMPNSSQEDVVQTVTQNDKAEKCPPVGNLVKDPVICVNGNYSSNV